MTRMLTIDRAQFRLTVWRWVPDPHIGFWISKLRFPIAVGMLGHETPVGLYCVDGKTRTPDWKAPDEDWVTEADRGVIFPFEDPKNPFAAGFISVDPRDGVGIHGTKFEPHVGEAVSHGCIRMQVPDFEVLYPLVPVGTHVFIY